jgi:nitrile hydratase subunit beta
MPASKSQIAEFPQITTALEQAPIFAAGELVRIVERYPIGHYRVPRYVRGKRAVVQEAIEPRAVNNEEEGFGRNAGSKRYYYRVAIELRELWGRGTGEGSDTLRIEVHESWLQRI